MMKNTDNEKTIDYNDPTLSGKKGTEGFSKNYAYSDERTGEELPPPPPPFPDTDPQISYIPPDQETPPANPKLVFGALAGLIILLVLAIGILLGRLSNTGGGVSKTEKTEASTAVSTEQDTSSTQPDTASTTENSKKTDSSLLYADIKDYKFSLDGVVYQLPCDYSEFTGNGWTMSPYSSTKETDKVPGKGSVYSTFVKGEHPISLVIYNPQGQAQEVRNCMIGGISIRVNDDVDFKMAKNIGLTSSAEAIEQAFGPPSNTNDSEKFTIYTYQPDKDNYQSTSTITIYKAQEDKKYNSITLRNLVFNQNDVASEEIPEYLSTYKQPTSMDPASNEPVFKLDGTLYRLPCPLKEFTDNGWTVKDIGEPTVPGMNKSTTGIILKKDDVSLYLIAFNFVENPMKTENCGIITISLSSQKSTYTDPLPSDFIVCPGNINPATSTADLKKTADDQGWELSENVTDTYTSTSTTYSSTDYATYFSYRWMDYKKTGESRSFYLTHNVWDY